jgi:hypothetical protein
VSNHSDPINRVFDIRTFNEVALDGIVDVPENSTSAGKIVEKLMFWMIQAFVENDMVEDDLVALFNNKMEVINIRPNFPLLDNVLILDPLPRFPESYDIIEYMEKHVQAKYSGDKIERIGKQLTLTQQKFKEVGKENTCKPLVTGDFRKFQSRTASTKSFTITQLARQIKGDGNVVVITNAVCGLEDKELIIFDGDSFIETLIDHGSFDFLGYLKEFISPKVSKRIYSKTATTQTGPELVSLKTTKKTKQNFEALLQQADDAESVHRHLSHVIDMLYDFTQGVRSPCP